MTGDDHANGGTAGRFDSVQRAQARPAARSPTGSASAARPTSTRTRRSTDAQAAALRGAGLRDRRCTSTTSCANYTPASLAAALRRRSSPTSRPKFPSLPAPATNRTHCIVVERLGDPAEGRARARHPARHELLLLARQLGRRTGPASSPAPACRCASPTPTAAMIDVYQAATQMTDESGPDLPVHHRRAARQRARRRGLLRRLHGQHAHRRRRTRPVRRHRRLGAGARRAGRSRPGRCSTWLDGRNGSSFSEAPLVRGRQPALHDRRRRGRQRPAGHAARRLDGRHAEHAHAQRRQRELHGADDQGRRLRGVHGGARYLEGAITGGRSARRSVSWCRPTTSPLSRRCIRSLLAQDYRDFEVLVMDDASTDATPEVARSFDDPRVRHVRNPTNLGHLRNFDRGLELARGRCRWLISADDHLRHPGALGRYVRLIETHPRVGYVVCPAVALVDGSETTLVDYSCRTGSRTRSSPARLLRRLLARRHGRGRLRHGPARVLRAGRALPPRPAARRRLVPLVHVRARLGGRLRGGAARDYRWHTASMGGRLRPTTCAAASWTTSTSSTGCARSGRGPPRRGGRPPAGRPLAVIYARGLARVAEDGTARRRSRPRSSRPGWPATTRSRRGALGAGARLGGGRRLVLPVGQLAAPAAATWAALHEDWRMPKALASALLLLGSRPV